MSGSTPTSCRRKTKPDRNRIDRMKPLQPGGAFSLVHLIVDVGCFLVFRRLDVARLLHGTQRRVDRRTLRGRRGGLGRRFVPRRRLLFLPARTGRDDEESKQTANGEFHPVIVARSSVAPFRAPRGREPGLQSARLRRSPPGQAEACPPPGLAGGKSKPRPNTTGATQCVPVSLRCLTPATPRASASTARTRPCEGCCRASPW